MAGGLSVCSRSTTNRPARATRAGQMEIDLEHLLAALLEQEEGLVPRILQRMDINPDNLLRETEKIIAGKPRVSGPGREPGKIYVSQAVNSLFARADHLPEQPPL